MGQLIVGNPNQNIMEEDQGSTANAASPSIAIVSQPGQMIEREITADNQIVKQGPPMVGRTDIVHNQVEINQTQAAAATSPMLTGMFSSLLKNQIDKVQRETITKFIVDGLKYLNSPQGNSSDAEIMRHIAIPNSIIQVDLAALGIRSLNININIHPQQGALNAASSLRCTQIIQTADNYQLPPNLQASLTGSQIKTTPTTRVYYRKKFKGKERASDKQTVTVVSENVDNIFAELQDDFVPTNSLHNTDKSKGKETMTKKGKCITPTSTLKLRRSPRFIKMNNGYRPATFSLKTVATKNKTKHKRIQPQADLLGNILLCPTSQASEFPGLSTVTKFNDMDAIFPEIPIVEIQKMAIETCCISPSEVTADILLASRPEAEACPSRNNV
jgi:hypothetical protein